MNSFKSVVATIIISFLILLFFAGMSPLFAPYGVWMTSFLGICFAVHYIRWMISCAY